MTTRVTIEPAPGFWVKLRDFAEMDGSAFQVKETGALYVQQGCAVRAGDGGLWQGVFSLETHLSTNFVGELNLLVHPRPDIDALLAAQVPEKEPEVVRVAFEKVEVGEWYLVDENLCKNFINPHAHPPGRDQGDLRLFERIDSGDGVCIYRDDWNNHTIEAADVKITARRKMRGATDEH